MLVIDCSAQEFVSKTAHLWRYELGVIFLKNQALGTVRDLFVWPWPVGSIPVLQQFQRHMTDRLVALSFRSWRHSGEKNNKAFDDLPFQSQFQKCMARQTCRPELGLE